MTRPWTRKPIAAGLGLAGTLCFFVAGCGGSSENADNAVVVTDPSTINSAEPSAAPAGGAAATPAAGSNVAATPSAPAIFSSSRPASNIASSTSPTTWWCGWSSTDPRAAKLL